MPLNSRSPSRARKFFESCSLAVLVFLSPVPFAHATPAFTVSNPDWDILVSSYGYSDLLLDRRPGFDGREFLSGEWAAAVCYTKGGVTHGPTWLEPEFIFPDWISNSDFGIEKEFGIANPSSPTNPDGFFVWTSSITNDCLRITMIYEMLDTDTGIAMGTAPKSNGGAGDNLTSSRYVFKHTYTIENISGQPITDLKLFQLLHGLETDTAIYDDRMYGGALGDYHYDSTQWGMSFSIHDMTGEIVLNHDWISFMSNESMPPTRWDTGYYGKAGVDDHFSGKPSTGLHLRIEANDLQNGDSFHPTEGRWVSGAQRYDLGNLAAGASVTKNVVLTLQTSYEVIFAGVNVEIRELGFSTPDTFKILFEETIGGPVGFNLWKATEPGPFDPNCFGLDCVWERVLIPYNFNPAEPELKWFEPMVDPTAPKCFFLIEPSIIATPPLN